MNFVSLFALILGFVLGRFSAHKMNKISTKTETAQISTQKVDISAQESTQKDSTTRQQTVYTEKFYNGKGKLIHEIDYGTKSGASVLRGDLINSSQLYLNSGASKVQNITIKSYQSNWTVGLYIPIKEKYINDPFNYNFQFSYRIFDGIFISALIDIKANRPQLGITINL